MDHLVVVDDEDSEVAIGHADSGRGRTRRTCQWSGAGGAERQGRAVLQGFEGGDAQAHARARRAAAGPTPSLVISSSTVSASPRTATSMRAGAAWRRALRIASPSTDCVTGSKIVGIVDAFCQTTSTSGALAASRHELLAQRERDELGRRGQRPRHRLAQVVAARRPARRRRAAGRTRRAGRRTAAPSRRRRRAARRARGSRARGRCGRRGAGRRPAGAWPAAPTAPARRPCPAT